MPNRHCKLKALRASEKRRVRNLRVKRHVKKTVKAYLKAIANKDVDSAREMLPTVFSVLDKAAKYGVIKKNTASRKKSRLSKKLSALVGA